MFWTGIGTFRDQYFQCIPEGWVNGPKFFQPIAASRFHLVEMTKLCESVPPLCTPFDVRYSRPSPF